MARKCLTSTLGKCDAVLEVSWPENVALAFRASLRGRWNLCTAEKTGEVHCGMKFNGGAFKIRFSSRITTCCKLDGIDNAFGTIDFDAAQISSSGLKVKWPVRAHLRRLQSII